MYTPERDMGGMLPTPARYALGWTVSEDHGHEVLGHSGQVPGFSTSFARVPDVGIAVLVLSNLRGESSLPIRIASAIQEAELTGVPPKPIDEPILGELDDAAVTALVGEYRLDAPSLAAVRAKHPEEVASAWNQLSLTRDGRHLFMNVGGHPGPEIHRALDGTFLLTHLAFRLDVERSDTGVATAVTYVPTASPGPMKVRYVRAGGG